MLKDCSKTKDISKWNEWRKDSHEMIYLQGANFRWACLAGANLEYAHLEGADFSYAHLEGSNFEGAILDNADLTETHMEKDSNGKPTKFNNRTILKYARLINTYLQGAQMIKVEFFGAEFSGTHFEEANLMYANFEKLSFYHEDVHFEGARLFFSNFKGTYLNDLHFERSSTGKRTDLTNALFNNAQIYNTNFKNADMKNVDFTDANLWNVDFEGADLHYAILEGTSISGDKDKSNLKNTDFTGATVNGKTIIQNCDIDEKTNFAMVGLDSARVEPKLLAALKANVRRIAWKKYYKERGKVKTSLICFFWWLSDYGSNTVRIFNTFIVVSLSFTLIYLVIAYLNPDPVAVLSNLKITGNWWLNFISALCFAVSTMVTLGFGGINVTIQECSPVATTCALFAVTFNLIAGYLILAVLVTRLGILFQSLPPEQKIRHEDTPDDAE